MAQAILPNPAKYFPFEHGNYDVKPGLKRFGTDFGNGPAETHVFQLDHRFSHYRHQKQHVRSSKLHEYLLTQDYRLEVAAAITSFVAERLAKEHPEHFQLQELDPRARQLDCKLTNEQLVFGADGQLDSERTICHCVPSYRCALDALACQVQEDLAVTCLQNTDNWLSALHVCLPSHWSPRKKIGRSFAEVHQPVAGMEKINRQQDHFVQQMVSAETGLVRFVWGLQIGDQLHTHPNLPEDVPITFEHMFARVERQTIWGLPHVSASLFTIRPYLLSITCIRKNPPLRRALIGALESMSVASRRYKGIDNWYEDFVQWLNQC